LTLPPLTRTELIPDPFTAFYDWLDAVEQVLLAGGHQTALLAVAGIAITVGGTSTADISLPHIAAIIIAAAFVAEGGVLIKMGTVV
jgi:hypothetical protein